MLKIIKIMIIVGLVLFPKFGHGQTNEDAAKARISELKQKIQALEIAKRTVKHEVIIFSIADKSIAVCTGVVLKNLKDRSYVLTAKHCVNESTTLFVENIKVSKIKISSTDDLALLELHQHIKSKEAIAFASLDAGYADMVYGLGYGNSFPMPLIGSIILTTENKYYARMQVEPGCSGAGLFSKKLELVGLLVNKITAFELGGYVPLSKIIAFLEGIDYEGKL